MGVQSADPVASGVVVNWAVGGALVMVSLAIPPWLAAVDMMQMHSGCPSWLPKPKSDGSMLTRLGEPGFWRSSKPTLARRNLPFAEARKAGESGALRVSPTMILFGRNSVTVKALFAAIIEAQLELPSPMLVWVP